MKRYHPIAVVAVLTVHVGLLVHSARVNSVTVDEAGHFAAGIHHWQSGTFALYRVDPPLPEMVAVLPAMAAGVETSFTPSTERIAQVSRPEGIEGFRLAELNGRRYFDLIFLARLAGILWSILAALLIYRWARELFGTAAGCFALVLWCFDPLVLGNAALVTPDVPATAAAIAATYTWWRFTRAPSRARAIAAAMLLGLALACKHTNLLLVGLFPVIWFARHWRWRWPGVRAALRPIAVYSALLVVSIAVLDVSYGCSGTGHRLDSFRFLSETMRGSPLQPNESGEHARVMRRGNRFADTPLGVLPVPVPADYLLGIDRQQYEFDRGMWSYLDGEWRWGGWWYYYLRGLSLKMPIGFIALIAISLAAIALRRANPQRRDELVILAIPLALLIVASAKTGFTHHVRYVLPALPMLYILASRLACSGGWRRGAIGALLAWGVVSSLRVHPHSLSYFNELAGGPERGSEHLVDSNVDWGQDLLGLAHWLERHRELGPVGVAYSGAIDPRVAGILYRLPPAGAHGELAKSSSWPRDLIGPQPGWYAVSVNFIRGMRSRCSDGEGNIRVVGPGDYDYFARLEPVDRIGYSILIFHVTAEQAAALDGEAVTRLFVAGASTGVAR